MGVSTAIMDNFMKTFDQEEEIVEAPKKKK